MWILILHKGNSTQILLPSLWLEMIAFSKTAMPPLAYKRSLMTQWFLTLMSCTNKIHAVWILGYLLWRTRPYLIPARLAIWLAWLPPVSFLMHHIDRLVQDKRRSSTLAMELRLSCANPSISYLWSTVMIIGTKFYYSITYPHTHG